MWGPPTLTADKRKYPFVGFPPRPELEHCLTPPGGAHSLYLHLLPEHRELWVHRHRPHLGMVRIAAPRPPAPTGSAHRSPVPSSRLWGPRCERVAQSRRLCLSLWPMPICVWRLQGKPLPCLQGLLGRLYSHCTCPGPHRHPAVRPLCAPDPGQHGSEEGPEGPRLVYMTRSCWGMARRPLGPVVCPKTLPQELAAPLPQAANIHSGQASAGRVDQGSPSQLRRPALSCEPCGAQTSLTGLDEAGTGVNPQPHSTELTIHGLRPRRAAWGPRSLAHLLFHTETVVPWVCVWAQEADRAGRLPGWQLRYQWWRWPWRTQPRPETLVLIKTR